LSQKSVSLPSGGSATDMLTVSAKANTPTGSYTVTLTVTGGGQSDTLQIPVTITTK
jgi:PKD repeat protein